MGHIFVSYSRQDQKFTLRLADNLERLYEVWIDREGIGGGLEFEKAIEKALEDCSAFVVVVSPTSNNSEWVARETIRAEQLGKHRIPILIAGDLPLRLLNLHYVDFQGEFAGGFQDLIRALNEIIDPEQLHLDEANRLLGAGVRAQLADDQTEADALVGQAIALQPEIAPSVAAFWAQLSGKPGSDFAAQWMPQVRVAEHTTQVGAYDDGNIMYEWSLSIDAPDDVLDQIDYVQYTLHKTFNQLPQIVRARDTNFRLTRRGWGVFDIPVMVSFKDGSAGQRDYTLTFKRFNNLDQP